MSHRVWLCDFCERVEVPGPGLLCDNCNHEQGYSSSSSPGVIDDEEDRYPGTRTPVGFTSSEDELDAGNGRTNGYAHDQHDSREQSPRSPRTRSISRDRAEARREIREGTRSGFFINDDDDKDDDDETDPYVAHDTNGYGYQDDSDSEAEKYEGDARESNGRRQ